MDDSPKAVIRRYVALWETGAADAADAFIAPTYTDSSHPEWPAGTEGLKRNVRDFHAAFSDVRCRIIHLISEGGYVALHVELEARHTGDWGPYPATDRQVVYRAMGIARVEGGKMAEYWSVADVQGWLWQLGAIGPPPA